jgi:exopolysaccharide production protein ExoZ
MTQGPRQIQFIQAMRGIAAFMVFGWHEASSFNTPIEADIFKFIFKNGIAGVDVFFVISGFIMMIVAGGSLSGGRKAAEFFIKRFSRIWPPYAVATFLYLTFMWNAGWLDPVAVHEFIPSIFFIPTASGAPSLGVGWTLNLEILFYIIFSLGILLGAWRWPFIIAVCFSISALKFDMLSLNVISDYIPSSIRAYLSQSLHPSFLEFFAGMLIGKLYLSNIKINRTTGIVLGSLGCSFAFWQYFSGLWGSVGILGWGIGAIALIFGLAAADKAGCVWSPPKFLLWLGKISFSLYLMHVTLFAVVTKYLNEQGFLPYTKGIGYMAFIITTVLLLSWLFHVIVEIELSKKCSNFLFSLLKKYQNTRRKAVIAKIEEA